MKVLEVEKHLEEIVNHFKGSKLLDKCLSIVDKYGKIMEAGSKVYNHWGTDDGGLLEIRKLPRLGGNGEGYSNNPGILVHFEEIEVLSAERVSGSGKYKYPVVAVGNHFYEIKTYHQVKNGRKTWEQELQYLYDKTVKDVPQKDLKDLSSRFGIGKKQ